MPVTIYTFDIALEYKTLHKYLSYQKNCNRHVLPLYLNFHNRHTDNDGSTVETCLLKFKKSHYF